jgi:DNA-binding MltR family transcriptional regulator
MRVSQEFDKKLNDVKEIINSMTDEDFSDLEIIALFRTKKIITKKEFDDYKKFMSIRNSVYHNKISYHDLDDQIIELITSITKRIDIWSSSFYKDVLHIGNIKIQKRSPS